MHAIIPAQTPRRRGRRQGAETLSGCEELGLRDSRSGAADLPQKAIQRTSGLIHQRFEPAELGRPHVAKLTCHLDDRLHFGQGAPRRVEETTVLSRTMPSVSLGDVQGTL